MPKRAEVILYPRDGFTEDKIIEIISSKASIKKFAIILHDRDKHEDGSQKEEHRHVYLGFEKNNWDFGHIAAWFGVRENQVQKIKGTLYDYIMYQLHWEFDESVKAHYQIDDITANFDVRKIIEDHTEQESVDQLLHKCADGTIRPYNLTNFVKLETYIKHKNAFDRAFEYFRKSYLLKSGGNRNCSIIWVMGESGIGKTTLCKLIAEKENKGIFISETGRDPFNHYEGQEMICLDEFRANEPFSYDAMLKLLDNDSLSNGAQSRYQNKLLICDTIMVTSVFSPEEIYREYAVNSTDSDIQFYRRITELWRVERDSIIISRYDKSLRKFVEIDTIQNPVLDYIATKNTDKHDESIGYQALLKNGNNTVSQQELEFPA